MNPGSADSASSKLFGSARCLIHMTLQTKHSSQSRRAARADRIETRSCAARSPVERSVQPRDRGTPRARRNLPSNNSAAPTKCSARTMKAWSPVRCATSGTGLAVDWAARYSPSIFSIDHCAHNIRNSASTSSTLSASCRALAKIVLVLSTGPIVRVSAIPSEMCSRRSSGAARLKSGERMSSARCSALAAFHYKQ